MEEKIIGRKDQRTVLGWCYMIMCVGAEVEKNGEKSRGREEDSEQGAKIFNEES